MNWGRKLRKFRCKFIRTKVNFCSEIKSRKQTIITCIYPIIINAVVKCITAHIVRVSRERSPSSWGWWNRPEDWRCSVNSRRLIVEDSWNWRTWWRWWNQLPRDVSVQRCDCSRGRQVTSSCLVDIAIVVGLVVDDWSSECDRTRNRQQKSLWILNFGIIKITIRFLKFHL